MLRGTMCLSSCSCSFITYPGAALPWPESLQLNQHSARQCESGFIARRCLWLLNGLKAESYSKAVSPTFLVPGTSFVEDNFSTGLLGDDLRMIQALHLLCTLFLLLWHQPHLRSSFQRLGASAVKSRGFGTALMVQWVRLHASPARGRGIHPWLGN